MHDHLEAPPPPPLRAFTPGYRLTVELIHRDTPLLGPGDAGGYLGQLKRLERRHRDLAATLLTAALGEDNAGIHALLADTADAHQYIADGYAALTRTVEEADRPQ